MANNLWGDGASVTITATGAFSEGGLVVLDQRAGVNVNAGVTGDLQVIALEGVYQVTKAAAADGWAVGEKVYANATNAQAATGAGRQPLGWATEVAATSATVGKVKLGGW